MSIRYYTSKYKFYQDWYAEMNEQERNSVVGEWVLENCIRFAVIIDEMAKSTGRFSGSSTNYQNQITNNGRHPGND